MSKPIIKVDSLKKHYRQYRKDPGFMGTVRSLVKREHFVVPAVDGVSFEVEKGEFVGFIGKNGAGKTTTLKCLSGILYPTSGEIEVLGYEPGGRDREFLKQISLVMGQKNQLWWDLPAEDSFRLNREIYDIPLHDYERQLAELVDLLDVSEVMDVQVRKLSLGQRMKCELIATLLHCPSVVFLDEPTIGLDVTMQKRLRDFFRDYNRRNSTTVMLTSHNMDDVRTLCSRVIIIDSGKIIYDGGVEELVRRHVKSKYISIRLLDEVSREEMEKYGEVIEYEPDNITISVSRTEVPSVSAALLKDFSVDDVDIREMDLDDVVRRIFTEGSNS